MIEEDIIVDLQSVFVSEIADYSPSRDKEPFEAFGLDSFDMVSLRAAIELALKQEIDDEKWVLFQTPSDIVNHMSSPTPISELSHNLRGERTYTIGMPQMAVSGLSEQWLFKEAGDLHWSLIGQGLGVTPDQIVDSNGTRLYATFVRFRVESTAPWSNYNEGDPLSMKCSISRYGAGQFLSTIEGKSIEKTFSISILSSFAVRSVSGSNKELLRGQPKIPEDCEIPALKEKPSFITEYQQRRSAQNKGPAIFEKNYDINPYVDINGVGLLYFASYPTISDFCELNHFGEGSEWANRSSTVFRDIFYFANSDASEVLRFSLYGAKRDGNYIETETSISRSDGVPMAALITRKITSSQ